MGIFLKIKKRFQCLSPFSLGVIKLGFFLSSIYCCVAILSSILFFYSPQPQRSLSLIHGGLGGSVPLLATAIVAALLCDLIFMDMKKRGKFE